MHSVSSFLKSLLGPFAKLIFVDELLCGLKSSIQWTRRKSNNYNKLFVDFCLFGVGWDFPFWGLGAIQMVNIMSDKTDSSVPKI